MQAPPHFPQATQYGTFMSYTSRYLKHKILSIKSEWHSLANMESQILLLDYVVGKSKLLKQLIFLTVHFIFPFFCHNLAFRRNKNVSLNMIATDK